MRLPAGSMYVTCLRDNPSRVLMLYASKETLQDCTYVSMYTLASGLHIYHGYYSTSLEQLVVLVIAFYAVPLCTRNRYE